MRAATTDSRRAPPAWPARAEGRADGSLRSNTHDEICTWVDRAFELVNTDTAAANAWAAKALGAIGANTSTSGRARHALGLTDCLLGRVAAGREHLRQATELLAHHGPALAACRAWRDYGSVLSHVCGDFHAGMTALERALEIVGTLDNPHEEGVLLSRLGPVLGNAGRRDEARRMLQRAVVLLADSANSDVYATALGNLGHNHLQAGEFAEAVPLLRRERVLRPADQARLHRANCEANLAVALAGSGQAAEAQALLADVALLLDPAQDGHQWVDYLLASGRVALFDGDAPAARAQLRQGLDAARAQSLRLIELELLSALAQAEEACGDPVAALGSERALRKAERRWLDDQAAARVRAMEDSMELARERTERQALEQARAELEQRVEVRTAELQAQMQEREAAQRQARYWADHDWLTRLPNRRQLKASLLSSLARAIAEGHQLGVLFLDLDGFKEVNDDHGHLAGDHILRLTARRLVRHAPPGAMVTRFGGDEFVVLVPAMRSSEAVIAVAQRLCDKVLAPMRIDGHRVRLSCSIGVAIGPRDASVPEDLLRRADRAMLEAKAAGRNRVLELGQGDQERLERRSHLRRELGAAIDDGRLQAVFQPLWDLRGQRLHGAELLARWNDPVLGPVSPSEFIPLAEESGLISRLGLWAVAQATAAARTMRAHARLPTDPGSCMTVNLSTLQLEDPQLVESLVATVRHGGGEPQWLQLELTESRRLAEDPAVRQRLLALRAAGFGLAIDDFGAGYSSFSYLNRLYFDRLKMDRSLVHDAMLASDHSAVTGSIILMAHRLGLDVVAEGIENAEQLKLLSEQGCDIVQGYHIARPMPLHELLTWSGPG